MKILHIVAVGAHPDDIELSMSGLLLRYGQAGHRITWIVATDGAAGGGGRDAELASARSSEAREAASLACATLVECGRPDGQLAWTTGADAIIGQHLAALKPDLIVTHSANDYHADHRAVARIVGDTTPIGTPVLRADNMLGLHFTPEILIDIGDVFDAKLNILAKHATQASLPLTDTVTIWNRFRSLQSSVRRFKYAEAYVVDRRLNAEIRPLLDCIGGYIIL